MKVWGGRSAGRKAAGLEPPTLVKRLPLTALAGEPPVSSLVQAGPVVELKVNGSRDIDAGEDDPQLASSYVTDIHQHLLSMEVRRRVRVLSFILDLTRFLGSVNTQHKYRAPSNYMSLQEDITERMRTILIDWYDSCVSTRKFEISSG